MFIPVFRALGLLAGSITLFFAEFGLLALIRNILEQTNLGFTESKERFISVVLNLVIVFMMSLLNVIVYFSTKRLA